MARTMEDLPTEMVKVEKLKPHPRNPNLGDVELVKTLIQENGWHGTITANKRTNHVVAGNHRLRAAIELKIPEVPVYWIDVDESAEQRIVVADNQAARKAMNDKAALTEILKELAQEEALVGTGFDQAELDELVAFYEGKADTTMREQTTTAQGMKEVVLVFTTDDHAEFARLLHQRRQRFATETASQAVLSTLEAVCR